MTTISLNPVEMLSGDIAAANTLAAKIKAASSDQSEAIAAIVDTHDDKKIAEYRASRDQVLQTIEEANKWLEDALASIEEHAATLLPSADDSFDVEKATAEFLAARKEITAKQKALATFVGGPDALAKILKDAGVEEITSLRGKRSGNTGSSTPRPRLSAATVDGKAVKDAEGKVTFTSLAAHLSTLVEDVKVDADYLKGAAFNAAGTRDLSSLPDNTVIEFEVKVGEESHKVSVTTRPKPGKRADKEAKSEK